VLLRVMVATCDSGEVERAFDDRPVTVLLGRFAPVVELGLAAVLRSDDRLRVLGSGLEDSAIEQAVARQAPQAAIVDATVESGLLARLRSRWVDLGIVVFAHEPARLTGTMLLAEQATCLAWSVPPAEICAAVYRAARGEPTFLCASDEAMQSGPVIADVLTKREAQVFAPLSLGWSYARIGRGLQIAPETVRTHTISICRKLGVEGKRELIGRSLTSSIDGLMDSNGPAR
jgi:DNA-binding NarL/FixJ family response regulator